MAKQPPKDNFLGGFTFNEAGARPAEADPAEDDSGPIRVPTRLTPQNVRTLITVIVVLALAAALYVVTESRQGTVVESRGHGISPDQRPAPPPTNF